MINAAQSAAATFRQRAHAATRETASQAATALSGRTGQSGSSKCLGANTRDNSRRQGGFCGGNGNATAQSGNGYCQYGKGVEHV